jgi:hypothetical protein
MARPFDVEPRKMAEANRTFRDQWLIITIDIVRASMSIERKINVFMIVKDEELILRYYSEKSSYTHNVNT